MLECEKIRDLKRLDLHYNFMSEQVRQQLDQLPGEVITDPGNADEDEYDGEVYRFVAVGE